MFKSPRQNRRPLNIRAAVFDDRCSSAYQNIINRNFSYIIMETRSAAGPALAVALRPRRKHHARQCRAAGGDVSMKQAKVPTEAEFKRLLAVIQQTRHASRNRMAVML